jgi:hypothetical protein
VFTFPFENSSAIASPTVPLFVLPDFDSAFDVMLPTALKFAVWPALIGWARTELALRFRRHARIRYGLRQDIDGARGDQLGSGLDVDGGGCVRL